MLNEKDKVLSDEELNAVTGGDDTESPDYTPVFTKRYRYGEIIKPPNCPGIVNANESDCMNCAVFDKTVMQCKYAVNANNSF